MPNVLVIGGPNGAGKSTLAEELVPEVVPSREFVNADVIAAELAPHDVASVALTAGRIMLRRLQELSERREHFAFETTMASKTFVPFLKELKAAGYTVHAAFSFLNSPELAIIRVAHRVEHGGHHIPEEDIRRRYVRGISNFYHLYLPVADHATVFDNSSPGRPRKIAKYSALRGMIVYDEEAWTRLKEVANGKGD